jgi:hypothetical protein
MKCCNNNYFVLFNLYKTRFFHMVKLTTRSKLATLIPPFILMGRDNMKGLVGRTAFRCSSIRFKQEG